MNSSETSDIHVGMIFSVVHYCDNSKSPSVVRITKLIVGKAL